MQENLHLHWIHFRRKISIQSCSYSYSHSYSGTRTYDESNVTFILNVLVRTSIYELILHVELPSPAPLQTTTGISYGVSACSLPVDINVMFHKWLEWKFVATQENFKKLDNDIKIASDDEKQI